MKKVSISILALAIAASSAFAWSKKAENMGNLGRMYMSVEGGVNTQKGKLVSTGETNSPTGAQAAFVINAPVFKPGVNAFRNIKWAGVDVSAFFDYSYTNDFKFNNDADSLSFTQYSVGAAVTFVAVDGSKNLIGCAIAPGISTSLSALSKSAELLTTVDLNKNPPSAIGKNTENSLLSGFVSGFACMIDGMAEKIAAEIGGDCRFLMSGCPQSVINCCKTRFEIDDDMILEGLYTIYLKNRM